MLSIRKKLEFDFDKSKEGVVISSGLTYSTNTIQNTTAIEFDINNTYEDIEIEGDFIAGRTYHFNISVNPNPDTFIDAFDELWVRLSSGSNFGTMQYVTKDDINLVTKIVADDKKIKINLHGDSVAGQITGWINGVTVQNNNWVELDITDSNIKLVNAIKKTNDLNKIHTQFSKSFSLMLNKQNLNALEINSIISTNFKNTNYVYDFKMSISEYNFDGILEVVKLEKSLNNGMYVATVNLFNRYIDFITRLKDEKLNTIQGLSNPEYVNTNIRNGSLATNLGNHQYCWLLNDYGQNITKKFFTSNKGVNRNLTVLDVNYDSDSLNLNESREYNSQTTFSKHIFNNNFYPAYFAKYLFKKIHIDNGFTVGGNLFDDDLFDNLLVFPANLTEEISETEYGLKATVGTLTGTIPSSGTTSPLLPLSAVTEYDNGSIHSDIYIPEQAMYCGFDYDITVDITASSTVGSYDVGGEFNIQYSGIGITSKFVKHSIGVTLSEDETKEVTFRGTLPSDVYIPKRALTSGGGVKFELIFAGHSNPGTCSYTVKDVDIGNLGLIQDRVAPTDTFKSSRLIPNISKESFIKQIITMFNLFPILEDNKIIYNTYSSFYTGSTQEITRRDIDVVSYELPSNFVKNKYIWDWNQNEIGDIIYYNERHNTNWGSYSKIGLNDGGDNQEFTNPFGINYHQAIEFDGGTVLEMGVNAKNKIEGSRVIFVGDPENYFYNNWEPKEEDITFGIWTNLHNPTMGGDRVEYLTEFFTTVDIDDINTAVYSEGSNSLLWADLYNKYYKTQIENITNQNTVKIKFKAALANANYSLLRLNSLIKIEDSYYHIEKINSFNGKDLTEMTLIKVNVNPFYS